MDFLSKGDQIHRKLRIWSHLLKKSAMENIIFRAVTAHRIQSKNITICDRYFLCAIMFNIGRESNEAVVRNVAGN